MAADPVVIVGLGMMTSVGLTKTETSSSVRAGVMRYTETDIRDRAFDRVTLAEVPEDALPGLQTSLESGGGMTARERRMLRLATMPLRESAAPLAGRRNEQRPPLCLALPEAETTRPLDRARFVHLLAAQSGWLFDPERSDGSHSGRAGGLAALGQAVAAIQAGAAEFVIAGGVDTYRDLFVLGSLDAAGRMKSARNLDGFIPGEGACFALLTSAHAAQGHGLKALAQVSPVAMGIEPGHLFSSEPYRGDGLAATFAALAATGAVEQPITDVYSSMNGESHWAKEWGVSQLRARGLFHPNVRLHHPADCFGDTGAACGPLMVGLAASAAGNGAPEKFTLVCSSSDRGPRAALIVRTAPH